ncbi:MAG: Gfo/Idh/MocA family oxidoreductase [Ignavibacteriales bacterium]|nr:Gfo/Idh/MocA family oxidoreductase [Ignavibacteriales bacterium]
MSKLRYGIIGFGGFAERCIAPAIKASINSELIAIQKRSLSAAQEKKKALGIRYAFSSAEELAACKEVDAVFVVSANCAHCGDTLIAANAGKHVLVEKPMAMNVSEAELMIKSCKAAGVKFMVGHMLRFSPLIMRMKDIVRPGTIGKITYARADFVYDASISQRRWVTRLSVAGGGPVFDIGVHCLDTLRFILDDEVLDVRAQLDPVPQNDQTEETASLSLKFSKDTLGSIYCSYRTPFRRTFIEILGTKGAVSAFNFTHNNATVPLTLTMAEAGNVTSTTTEDILIPDLYVKEVTLFSDAILNNTAVPVPGEIGLRNQIVLDKALASE